MSSRTVIFIAELVLVVGLIWLASVTGSCWILIATAVLFVAVGAARRRQGQVGRLVLWVALVLLALGGLWVVLVLVAAATGNIE